LAFAQIIKGERKILKNKNLAILFALLLTASMTTSIVFLPSTNAHTPGINIPTYTFCSVSPNPIGAGQQVNVNFWVNQPPPTASAQYGDRWGNMTVMVTHPDGTTETLGPLHLTQPEVIHSLHSHRHWQLYFPNVVWRTNINRSKLGTGDTHFRTFC
jgi:hypothetical protein